MQIILIGLLIALLVVYFERRRDKVLAKASRECTDMARAYWDARAAEDKRKIEGIDNAIAQLASAMEAQKQQVWETAKQNVEAIQRAELRRAGSGNTRPAPVGAFGSDGVYREGGQAVAWYDVRTDDWKDRDGKVVPDPRQGKRTWSAPGPSSLPVTATRAERATAQASADPHQAMQAAMLDAQLYGVGMTSSNLGEVRHVPVHEFRGGGGSFDGGGASGDYDRGSSSSTASDSCSSSSASTSSDSSSSSCSSSDSGGGSSGSSD